MSRLAPKSTCSDPPSAETGGSRFQEEQGLKGQGSGLPSGGEAEIAENEAFMPVADDEAVPVEVPDVDGRFDVAGANEAGLKQAFSRCEEVQDHRVDDLPRRGNLVDLGVHEALLLAPFLGERAFDGVLADEPPPSRLGALGELLTLIPVLLEEQLLASLLPHVEEREPHVGDEDVRFGNCLERLLGEGDDLEGEQIGEADGTEVLHDLGDAEEVLAHDLADRPLAGGLAVVDTEFHEQLLEMDLELVSPLDDALGCVLRCIGVAECIHHDALDLLLLRGRDLCSHRRSPSFSIRHRTVTAGLEHETGASNSKHVPYKAPISCKNQSLHVKEQEEDIRYFWRNVNVLASKSGFLWDIWVIFGYKERPNARSSKICGSTSDHCLICWIKVFQCSIQLVTNKTHHQTDGVFYFNKSRKSDLTPSHIFSTRQHIKIWDLL